MSRSRFHQHLAQRLLRATTVAFLLAPAAVACSGNTTVDDDDDDGGSAGHGGGANTGGHSTGGTSQGGMDNSGGMGNVGNEGVAGQGNATPGEVTSCYNAMAEDIDDCAPAIQAGPLLQGNACGMAPHVISGPTFDNGNCCYLVVPEPDDSCGVGRPYTVEVSDEARHRGFDRVGLAAAPTRGTGWSAARIVPDVAGLPAPARAALAEAWLRDALLEHASIASFGRFALELMAVGAPAELVEQAHQAALDEVRHARACFALASAYAGSAIGPAPFPFGGSAEVRSDLATIAAAVVREGCIGETLAAAQAAAQLERATDPAVRAVLAAIAEDESRHAELAWRTVAWAVRVGGEPVREVVRRAFEEATGSEPESVDAPASFRAAMSEHGRLGGGELAERLEEARRDVVRPCMNALLG